MREFFRGWKRKVGCVTLVFACAFAAWWVRGHSLATNTEGIRFCLEFTSVGIDFECEDFGHEFQPPDTYSSHLNVLAELFVPYWTIVLPMTLFSAYLVLSKPRQSKRQTEDDRNPVANF